jgi:thiol-disulfide isomerase/thioredoxin
MFSAAVCAALATGCGSGDSPPKPNGDPAPAESPADRAAGVTLKILDLEGIRTLRESHRGKVVVVDYWSTSCVPCMKEFPGLVRLANEHPGKVACISLSVDYEGIGKPEDKKDVVLEFLTEQKATFDNVLASTESDELFKAYGFASPPVVDVYDASGKLARRFENTSIRDESEGFTYQDIGRLVDQLLAE